MILLFSPNRLRYGEQLVSELDKVNVAMCKYTRQKKFALYDDWINKYFNLQPSQPQSFIFITINR